MNPIARVEQACARFVEDAFARVFPSQLEPEHVGRKLVAMMQATAGDLYLVRVHPADFSRFAADRTFLETRWAALLGSAGGRSESAPRVVLHEDGRVVAGSVAIETVLDAPPGGLALAAGDGVVHRLHDGLRLGRASDNDLVIADRRVSRYHARITSAGSGFAVEDLGSSNGSFIDGRRIARAQLRANATLSVGDTHFRVGIDAG